MADKEKLEPMEGPNGVDRWSSNGFGLTVNGKKVEPITEDDAKENTEEIDDIEEV